jgi:MSHA biogenesis protein MshO
MGRDVKLALPNSVRTATAGTSEFVEFIAVRTAGRYRADGGGPAGGVDCDNDDATLAAPDNDQLSFDLPAGDRCFKTLGKLPGAVATGSDQLVLNNYGFPDQDAYQTAGTLNRVVVAAVDTTEAGRDRVSFATTTFVRALHDSLGKRFFVISGPVTYECDLAGSRILRHSGYALSAAQPTAFGGTPALVAEHVSFCQFEYSPSVSAQLGLLTLRLRLQRQLFGGTTETVSLYHAVHVNNAP